jgi:acyl-CoA thioesterase I
MQVRIAFLAALSCALAGACDGAHASRGCRLLSAEPPLAAAIVTLDGGMPLLGRSLPVFASQRNGDAAKAIDADYSTTWRSAHQPTEADPDWIAVDLSSVPRERRQTLYSLWFNEAGYAYDTFDGHGYALPGDYRIESNPAPGGGSPPKTGWVTLKTALANTLSSGADVLPMQGANWLRFLATKPTPNAAPMNVDTSLEWELYDAHQSVDAWKFAGDSITANAMTHAKTNDAFDQLVQKQSPHFPAFEMAGHGGWTTTDLLRVIDAYLKDFPGRYFAIALGTNDGDPTTFGLNMNQLVAKVLAAGKVPVVPTIPYTGEPAHVPVIDKSNLEIERLYATFGSRLVRGPDLYKVLFVGRDAYFDNPTDLHPNARGNLAIRKAWADAAVRNVYR